MPALPKLDAADPAVREYLMTVAEHWLRFGIDGWRLDVPDEIRDRVLAGVPAALPRDPTPMPTWSARSGGWPRVAGGGPLRRPDGLPAGRGDPGLRRRHAPRPGHRRGAPRVRRQRPRLDGPAFAARLGELLTAYDPDVVAVQLNLLGSHDTPRLRSILGGDRDGVRLATLLQRRCPARRASTTGTRWG